MERKTIGSFLSALRKANGMTQQEVAEKLNVSNKTVSKWERDEGYPEILILPAIAELYGVSVDEILRGEKVNKPEEKVSDNTKSKKRAEYLFEKSVTKYKNQSVISVTLSVAAGLFGFFSETITWRDLSKTWICILVVIASAVAAVIVQLIAFNNINSVLKSCDENIDEGYLQKVKVNVSRIITLTMVFSLYGIIGAVSVGFSADGILVVPFALVICIAVGWGFYLKLCKILDIKRKMLSVEALKYRKKHIKATAVIVSLIFLLCGAYPFVQVAFEAEKYYFADEVYWNDETGENAYNKLKAFVTEGKTLYYVNIEMAESYGFVLEEIAGEYVNDNGVYEKVSSSENSQVITKVFDTSEEAEKFRKEFCWEADFDIEELEKNIKFDDSDYTVSYKSAFFPINRAYDILWTFLFLVAPVASGMVVLISVVIYLKNKKKIG